MSEFVKTDLQHQMVERWDELCNGFLRLKKSAVAVFQYLPKHVRDLFHSACKAVSTSAKRMDKLLPKVSKVLGVMDLHQQKGKDNTGTASNHMTHHQSGEGFSTQICCKGEVFICWIAN